MKFKKWPMAILLITLASEAKALCSISIASAADSALTSRLNEKFLIIVSCTFIPNQVSRNLLKGVNPEL